MPHTKNKWSDWTDWTWSQDYHRWYRQRQDHGGNLQTQWDKEVQVDKAEEEPRPTYSNTFRESWYKEKARRSIYPDVSTELGYFFDDGTSGTAGTADQTDEENERKRGSDRGRRNKNQYKFRHPEKTKLKDVEQDYNQDHKPDDESDYESGYHPSSSALQATPQDFASDGDDKFDAEQIDTRYRVEPEYKFQPGEVFKTLWSEPNGGKSGTLGFRDCYGWPIFISFRHFVVIANDAGHCTCVPIHTYGNKGCTKTGVKAEGMIYNFKEKGKSTRGEPVLGFSPVRINIMASGEELAPASRVDYSRLVTVEHNVKVFFIGHIIPEDLELVTGAVNACWDRKSL